MRKLKGHGKILLDLREKEIRISSEGITKIKEKKGERNSNKMIFFCLVKKVVKMEEEYIISFFLVLKLTLLI